VNRISKRLVRLARWVLKDVSFTVEAGESVASSDYTGSGKTTTTNLLMRFYDVSAKEKILLDGVDVRVGIYRIYTEEFHRLFYKFCFPARDCRQCGEQITDRKFSGRRARSTQASLSETPGKLRGGGQGGAARVCRSSRNSLLFLSRALAFNRRF